MWITGVERLLSEMEPDDAAALVAVASLLERLAARCPQTTRWWVDRSFPRGAPAAYPDRAVSAPR
ncbi:hypothetical protein [Rhodococcus sp. DMU1]|uniref:hypothetical protein n=1 Tax=Rhodococcus sp. DMU1 TaxID=2722825 RepID=UPI001B2FEF69|nr:hypothetical protein [Rhodococcus sp. DMU1]